MAKKPLVVLLSVLLSACSVTSPSTPNSEKITLKPFPTSTALPRPAPTETPSAIPPSPTADPDFFRDEFAGTLNPQWTWVREDRRNWSLKKFPGFLQINVEGGYVVEGTNSNMLLRSAPKGDFQIETQIKFSPSDNYQFAGLIIYESDANFIQAGRGYCRTYECIGEGLYMNYYQKGKEVMPNFGQVYRDLKPIQLRLSRKGDNYTFEASTDGKVWFIVGSHTSSIQPLKVGLVAGQKMTGEILPAVFDYFEVRSLP